jgi:hypothetical protein
MRKIVAEKYACDNSPYHYKDTCNKGIIELCIAKYTLNIVVLNPSKINPQEKKVRYGNKKSIIPVKVPSKYSIDKTHDRNPHNDEDHCHRQGQINYLIHYFKEQFGKFYFLLCSV